MSRQATEAATPAPASRGLGRLLASTGSAVTGQGVATAATPLLAASLTQDPLVIAIVAACSWLPWLIVGLPLGTLVDRSATRPVMVGTDLARAILVGGFAVAVVAGFANVWLLAAVVFLVGVGSCLFDPAAQATIPFVVGREKNALTRANGAIWSLDTFGRSLVGPLLGAVSFAVAGFLPFAAQATLFGLSALLLIGIPSRPAPDRKSDSSSLASEVREGLRFLFRTTGLRYLAIAMGCYNFAFQLANSTLVLVASRRLDLGATGFGILLAAMAVGGVVSGRVVHLIGDRPSTLHVYALAFLFQALGWVLVAVTPFPIVAGLGMVILGACSTVVSAVGGAARQTLTPDRLMGRVASSTRLVGIGAAALGALLGGVVAGLGLLVPLATAAGLLLIATVAFIRTPRIG